MTRETRRQPAPTIVTTAEPEISPQEDLERRLRDLLSKRQSQPASLEELSDTFDVGIGRIRDAVHTMKEHHVNVQQTPLGTLYVGNLLPAAESSRIDLRTLKGEEFKFGVTGDNHLASKYSRLDVLESLFDIWEDQGVTTVYQCGNIIDGEARFNKGDLLAYGIEGQIDFLIQNWPVRKGITTQFITGDDHEGWYIQRENVDIGRIIEDRAKTSGREDMVYIGHMEHDVELHQDDGKATMRFIHAGGGSSYAVSYSQQKIVESYQGGEKPTMLFIGHYHKIEYGYPRGVHAVQVGATQDQTPFLRKKKIESQLGGATISFTQSTDGLIHGFTPRFDTFYDRGFYGPDSKWKYYWDMPGHRTKRAGVARST